MSLLVFSTILAVAIGLIYYYLTSTFKFWSDRGIPYIPEPKLLYGNLKDAATFKLSTVTLFNNFYKEYKTKGYSSIGMFMFRSPTLLVIEPRITKEVLIKNFPAFHDRNIVYDENFDPLTAHLGGLDGQKWKFMRAKLSPTFTSGKLKAMFDVTAEATKGLLQQFKEANAKNGTLDIRETMAQYTTDVIGSAAFGLELKTSGNRESEFRKMGRKVFEPSALRRTLTRITTLFPWVYRLFQIRRFDKATSHFFINLFKETVDYRKSNKITRNDFLHLLMELKDSKVTDVKDLEEMQGVDNYNTKVQQNVMELSDEILTAQLFFFFLAGFETSSTAMSFTLYELSQNEDIQERAVKDIKDALDKHGGLTYEAINDMKYLEQIIYESLRKYPPVPHVSRKCTQTTIIPGTNAPLEKDVIVLIPTYSFHHDPEYFPEPNVFNPDRFSEENKEKIVPGSFVPFGDGPRICIGMRFAMMEMKIGFAALLPKYRILPSTKTKPPIFEESSFILTPKDGIWLNTVEREQKSL